MDTLHPLLLLTFQHNASRMPAYLRQIRIDWSYDLASSSLQNALRAANQRLSSRDHTPLTFDEQLRRFASEHTDARATALIEEDERTYLLFRVQNGTVTRVDVERSADGSFVTEPDLIARLLHGDFAPVPEPPAHPDDKKGQALYFPEPMLDEIRGSRRIERPRTSCDRGERPGMAVAPSIYEPVWTFIPGEKQGIESAFAVAVGPFGEVYAGGIGATNHPAFAVILEC